MSISQHEAVSLLNHTIFRPGWRVSAAPAPGSDDHVQVGIEIETVDSSFVTRGGEYRVPLTERALIVVSASDYSVPEELLFRVLAFVRELEVHEDREFWRTWNDAEERWEAPFHSHAPGSDEKWKRLRALPPAPVTRVSVNADGPWLAEDAGCEYVCWAEDDNKKLSAHGRTVNAGCDMEEDRGDCWESGNGKQARASVTGCEDGIIDQDCWENGKRALISVTGCAEGGEIDNDCYDSLRRLSTSSPCNEQQDDDEEGPQRVLADADCTLGPPGRALVNAGCASDGEVNCSTNIDTPGTRAGHHRMLVHAMAHSASDPCTEDHGGCAEWG